MGKSYFRLSVLLRNSATPHTPSAQQGQGVVCGYMRCVLQVVIMKTKAVFTKGCVAALSVAGIIKHVEKSSLRDKAFVSG